MPTLNLRTLTSKWWFYLLLFLIPLLVPPYTSKPMTYEQVGELMGIVVREALKPYDWLAPVFHLATICMHAKAEKGEDLLKEILKTDEGAKRIGEIAIGTNNGISKFTKNMLFDEKMGHCMHLAIGLCPSPAGTGGKNQSSIHWDFLKDMQTGEIYADNEMVYGKGRFVL